LGYRKLDTREIPSGYKSASAKNDDVYPISIFGEEKPIPNNKLGKYINDEFNFYNDIYNNVIDFGLPYENWVDAPHWVLDLHKMFKRVDEEYQSYLMARTN